VSLGVASAFKDVHEFVAFARCFIGRQAPPAQRATFAQALATPVTANA
jgi:hypothetical protein